MSCWLTVLFAGPASVLKTRAALQLEKVALRHQIGRPGTLGEETPTTGQTDRLLWVWLSRVWTDWRSSLVIVAAKTVVAWHRNLQQWLIGAYHGVSKPQLQIYLD